MKVAIGHNDNYLLDDVARTLDRMYRDLGLPADNPFSEFVKPGMTVFIKPNWVASKWRESCAHKDTLYSVITHPVVIEAVADKVALALKGRGRIIIGDNPSIDADFQELMEFTRIECLKHKYDVPCEILDLRPLVCKDLRDYGKKEKMVEQIGDPLGEIELNLGRESLLYGVESSLFRGVFDEREETIAAHTGLTQLYTFSKTLYDADVYISIPKLKTHQKVGATLNLKGLVGSICRKNQLVHWRIGYPEVGGDEYPDKKHYSEGLKAKVKHRGAWPGNDTIWRMVVDLYQGMLKKERKYFSVIDGIVAGEGQGPFCPTAKYANTLIAGTDLLYVDMVATRMMGLNPMNIRYLQWFIENMDIDLKRDFTVLDNGKELKNFFYNDDLYLDFYVPPLWAPLKFDVATLSRDDLFGGRRD